MECGLASFCLLSANIILITEIICSGKATKSPSSRLRFGGIPFKTISVWGVTIHVACRRKICRLAILDDWSTSEVMQGPRLVQRTLGDLRRCLCLQVHQTTLRPGLLRKLLVASLRHLKIVVVRWLGCTVEDRLA